MTPLAGPAPHRATLGQHGILAVTPGREATRVKPSYGVYGSCVRVVALQSLGCLIGCFVPGWSAHSDEQERRWSAHWLRQQRQKKWGKQPLKSLLGSVVSMRCRCTHGNACRRLTGWMRVFAETMERTHDKVKDVQHMNETSKWLLRGMSSWTGRIRNMFSKPPEHPKDKEAAKKQKRRGGAGAGSDTGNASRRSAAHAPPSRRASAPVVGASAGRARMYGGHAATGEGGSRHATARQQEDAMADELRRNIARLKAIAAATGDELEGQNKLMDDIQTDVDKAYAGMKKNRATARRIT